jgi:hypothetical protein
MFLLCLLMRTRRGVSLVQAYNMNAVAFYVLKGRLLVVFYEVEGGTTACVTFQNIEPDQIAATLDQKVAFPFHAMCLVFFVACAAREAGSWTRNKPVLRG